MTRFFSPSCRRGCSRLSEYLMRTKKIYPDYHCAPVAPLGPLDARLVIVGLAPGKHGANRSGRVFTGDYAGVVLYKTLYKYGFSNQPTSISHDDSLVLNNCRITNAVKCLPPDNKPNLEEIKTCNRFLKAGNTGVATQYEFTRLGACRTFGNHARLWLKAIRISLRARSCMCTPR